MDPYPTYTVRNRICLPGFLCIVQELPHLWKLAHEGRLVTLHHHIHMPQHQLLNN